MKQPTAEDIIWTSHVRWDGTRVTTGEILLSDGRTAFEHYLTGSDADDDGRRSACEQALVSTAQKNCAALNDAVVALIRDTIARSTDLPSYCPDPSTFEPHAWAREVVLRAYLRGLEDLPLHPKETP